MKNNVINFVAFSSILMYCFPMTTSAQANNKEEAINKRIVQKGFNDWASGRGSFFDLLTEDVQWTISGSSPLSKTYSSKKELMDEVITPLNERLSEKIIPAVRSVYADGNTVIVIWDGKAKAADGRPYLVSYAWFMEMKNGKINKVTAFLDTIDFADIMQRIKP